MYHVTAADLERAVPMSRAIQLVRQAFIDLSSGAAVAPVRSVLSARDGSMTTLVMPARLDSAKAVSVKVVSVAPGNVRIGMPVVNGLVFALHPATGEPLGTADAPALTALRTGAATGLATEFLARRDARRLAMIGGGAQARKQVEGVLAVRDIESVTVTTRSPKTAKQFAKMCRLWIPRGVRVDVEGSAERAVREADVVCTATPSPTPVFPGDAVRPGTHVNGIGSFRPDMREVDDAFLRRCDKIVVDQRAAAWEEAGELIHARQAGYLTDVYAELGQIAVGMKMGRRLPEEITFFKSVGNAVQDAAIMGALFPPPRR